MKTKNKCIIIVVIILFENWCWCCDGINQSVGSKDDTDERLKCYFYSLIYVLHFLNEFFQINVMHQNFNTRKSCTYVCAAFHKKNSQTLPAVTNGGGGVIRHARLFLFIFQGKYLDIIICVLPHFCTVWRYFWKALMKNVWIPLLI